jgi:hypothetical protein
MSCQNSQPFSAATRRLTNDRNAGEISPDPSNPVHIERTPRKIVGRRAYSK